MRDNPIHSFFLFMTGQLGDQIAAGGMRWVTVVYFWLLAAVSIAVVVINWQRDPSQRTANNVAICALRFLGAGMWFVGSLWKLPLPVSGGFKFWMDSTVKFSSWQFHADIMQFLNGFIVIVGPLIYLLEVSLATSLMLGLLVRLSGTIGALFIFNLMIGLFNDPTEWVWTYVGLIGMFGMFAATGAGRSLGLDNIIAKRLLPVFEADSPLLRVVRWAT